MCVKFIDSYDFFVVENVELGSVDYCCTLCMIPNNYSEAVNSPDSKDGF